MAIHISCYQLVGVGLSISSLSLRPRTLLSQPLETGRGGYVLRVKRHMSWQLRGATTTHHSSVRIGLVVAPSVFYFLLPTQVGPSGVTSSPRLRYEKATVASKASIGPRARALKLAWSSSSMNVCASNWHVNVQKRARTLEEDYSNGDRQKIPWLWEHKGLCRIPNNKMSIYWCAIRLLAPNCIYLMARLILPKVQSISMTFVIGHHENRPLMDDEIPD